MEDKIKDIIKIEVKKHEYSLDEAHTVTIVDAIYKQLSEYLNTIQLQTFVEVMQPDFLKIVDNLIPIVKEYESKINDLLDSKIGNLIAKL